MARSTTPRVKKTVTLPRDLVDKMRARNVNVSAFITAACLEKLSLEARQERESAMAERCRVRYQEDLQMLEDFATADAEGWTLHGD